MKSRERTTSIAPAAAFAFALAGRIAAASANSTAPPTSGSNYTVGGRAGWFFDGAANASAANYSAWAANLPILVGDYLVFNTNTDNPVVHTTNETAYRLCGGVGSGCSRGGRRQLEEEFLTVMLTKEGPNYFFSDAGCGARCRLGMRFEIVVAYGCGLPPVPPSYYEPLSGAYGRSRGMDRFTGVAVLVILAILIP